MQDKIKIQMMELQPLLLLPHPPPKPEFPLPHPPQRNKRMIIHQQLLPPFPQVLVVQALPHEFVAHELLHPQEDKSPIVASK
jgi:hypothetical protein